MVLACLLIALLATPSPEAEARIPLQRTGDPFAIATIGGSFEAYSPTARTWSLPAGAGAFSEVAPPFMGQGSLRIGALHFFGHADIHVDLPLVLLRPTATSGRTSGSLSVSHTNLMGVDVYPWALRPGTLRPYLASALTLQSITLDGVESGRVDHLVLPLGVGLGWRTTMGAIFDAQLQYVFGKSGVVASGVEALPFPEDASPSSERKVPSEGWRWLVGARWGFDTSSGIVQQGWWEAEVARLQARIDNGTASTFTLALGPSSRILRNGSPYFEDLRPYLGRHYQDGSIFLHGSAGYYHFPLDAEVRLAFRAFSGRSTGGGVSLETSQQAGFLEVLKFFDVGLYGFVPFVGAGVGYGKLSFEETLSQVTIREEAWQPLLSFPVGWDIRVTPAGAWLLRTSLRWIPVAPFELPNGTAFDFGGLEFDFIQLVVFPERLLEPV